MNQSHTQQQQQKGGNSFGILPVVSKSQTNKLGGSASGGSISGIKGENTVEKSYTYHQQQEHQHGNSQRGRVGMVARKAATGGNGRSGSKSARRTGHEAPAILQQQQQHTVMLLQKKQQPSAIQPAPAVREQQNPARIPKRFSERGNGLTKSPDTGVAACFLSCCPTSGCVWVCGGR